MRPRLTDLRQEILETIRSASIPVNTKAIIRHLSSGPDVSTVYRALDYLETQGYIHHISFSRTKYYFTDSDGGCGHFLHCRNCHEIRRFETCSAADLQESLQERFQYRISRHVLSFEGICSDCQVTLDKQANAVA